MGRRPAIARMGVADARGSSHLQWAQLPRWFRRELLRGDPDDIDQELRQIPPALRAYCAAQGRAKGGRPTLDRRCTKRLGTRFCWLWRTGETDRCLRHQRDSHDANARMQSLKKESREKR